MSELSGSTVRADYMQEILSLLSINNDQLINNPLTFWQEVATVIGVQPGETELEACRMVLEVFTDWDEDYISEDATQPSDQAYRELLSVLNDRTRDGAVPWSQQEREIELASEEDDDDSSQAWEFGVGQQAQPDIRTVLGMVFDRELVVNPEWQRNFVWPIKKQRAFIESILMGLPIPSLLLFEEIASGTKYVIDGRQRLETLARYCATGTQRDALPFLGKRFKTFSSREPRWREGQDLNAAANKYYEQLPATFKRRIDRAVLTMFTFKSLQPRQLYQIFQRYNTGAEKLKAAEIRNAVYQASPLHKLIWRMAGESPDRIPFQDSDEQYVAETLRNIMQNKTARYGAYDFIGRVLAFTYLNNNKTVAAATNDFMDQFENGDHDLIRSSFLHAFEKVVEWYNFPLSTPAQNGGFHNFLGTIQLVTTHQALRAIDAGETTEAQIKNAISSGWTTFAHTTLEMKQNSGTFWQRQRDWWAQLQATALRG